MNDDTKRRIFARRAQLVAAALTAACEPAPKPAPCLETIVIPESPDASLANAAIAPPVPCLEPALPPIDAGEPDAAKPDAGKTKPDAGAKPQPCLKPVRPTVCLYMD